jgi:deoxyribodipyrimidine photo-lyase
MQKTTLVIFRQDLRLADNPALQAALAVGPIVPVYVLDDETAGAWRMGGASRWWLHHSLVALAGDIERRDSRLILRRGKADEEIQRLVEQTGAHGVFWNRCYEPFARERDTRL